LASRAARVPQEAAMLCWPSGRSSRYDSLKKIKIKPTEKTKGRARNAAMRKTQGIEKRGCLALALLLRIALTVRAYVRAFVWAVVRAGIGGKLTDQTADARSPRLSCNHHSARATRSPATVPFMVIVGTVGLAHSRRSGLGVLQPGSSCPVAQRDFRPIRVLDRGRDAR
jgi:hypothetical protein